jgi:3-phosphoshikimate 1-carboxyvinyltransferase
MPLQIIVPGDKSITHRALMLAALARGRSELRGALVAGDTKATARFLRAVGAGVGPLVAGRHVVVQGRRLERPDRPIDCGNSGTTARLGMGLVAASRFAVALTGDRSLRSRPMRRVTDPLTAMGARFDPPLADRLPFVIRGGRLRSIRWPLPVSSAQLKSAILLAGLVGEVPVAIFEPAGLSRDHTERILRALGAQVETRDGWIEFEPGRPLAPFSAQIPGDASSAAFLVGAALIAGREIVVDNVGLNPTRTRFLTVLQRMGAKVETTLMAEPLGEPVGTIRVVPGPLRATIVAGAEIPGLIDEIPLLAVVAARAEGTTRFEDVGELRVKESDRLALMAANLAAVGYSATGEGNVLTVAGSDHPPRGAIQTAGDHRLAMAFGALGLAPGAAIRIDDRGCVAVSFPGYFAALRRIAR